MNIKVFVADCDDKGFTKTLSDNEICHERVDRYYYPTGADHPGIWILATFIGTSIAGGFVHDGFKTLLKLIYNAAMERWQHRDSDGYDGDDGPCFHCLVMEFDDLKVEWVIDRYEPEVSRIQSVLRKIAACRTLLEREDVNCSVQLPLAAGFNHWCYERSIPESGERFWLLSFDDGESVVFDSFKIVIEQNPDL